MEAVALDKSCIITGKQKCIFIAEQTETVLKIIEDRCRNYKTPLKVFCKDFYCENIQYSQVGMKFDVVTARAKYTSLVLPLLGIQLCFNNWNL